MNWESVTFTLTSSSSSYVSSHFVCVCICERGKWLFLTLFFVLNVLFLSHMQTHISCLVAVFFSLLVVTEYYGSYTVHQIQFKYWIITSLVWMHVNKCVVSFVKCLFELLVMILNYSYDTKTGLIYSYKISMVCFVEFRLFLVNYT